MLTMAMTKPHIEAAYATDAQRWLAVQRRDRQADGEFYYSVEPRACIAAPPARHGSRCARMCGSTGLAPTPNVPASGRASAASRIRPPMPAMPRRSPHACRTIAEAEEMPSLDALAAPAGLSRFHFHRLFKAATGLTPRQYGAAHRAKRVRDDLPKSATVTAGDLRCRLQLERPLLRGIDRAPRDAPSALSAGRRRRRIRFAVVPMLARRDPGGGDGQGRLRDRVRRRAGDAGARACRIVFPTRRWSAATGLSRRWPPRRSAWSRRRDSGTDLPLDVRGTAFQQRVWQALREIPAGKTASYAEMAQRIGSADAVRAVAQACAANPLAIAIPCHRVVRTDGALSGYRWGVERKRELLRREARRVTTLRLVAGPKRT